MEVDNTYAIYLSNEGTDMERSKRKRDTVDWSSRLSREGQFEDGDVSSPITGKSSRRGRGSAASAADTEFDSGSVMSASVKRDSRKRNSGGASDELKGGRGSGKKKGKRVLDDGANDSVTSSGPSVKRSRGSGVGGGDETIVEDDEHDTTPIDIKDEVHRYMTHQTIESTPNVTTTGASGDNIPPPLAAFVDLWVRWLWLLYTRLLENDLWRKKSDALIVSSCLDRRGGGVHGKKIKTVEDVMRVKNWRNIVLRSTDEDAFEQLMLWADKRNLKSSRRLVRANSCVVVSCVVYMYGSMYVGCVHCDVYDVLIVCADVVDTKY